VQAKENNYILQHHRTNLKGGITESKSIERLEERKWPILQMWRKKFPWTSVYFAYWSTSKKN
jgi:hypothetical protein